MNNLKQLETGNIAELNERYGLISRAPLDVLTDAIKAKHDCSGKLIVREKNGVYTISERTAPDEHILRAYNALYSVPADEPRQITLERAKRLYCGQYDSPMEWVKDEVTREGYLLPQSVREYVIDWHAVLNAMSYRYAVYNGHYFKTPPEVKDYLADDSQYHIDKSLKSTQPIKGVE